MAMAKSSLLLSFGLVALLLVVTAPAAYGDVSTIEDSFDIDDDNHNRGASKRYAAFLADLDYHVGTTGERTIKRHTVLGRQQLNIPPAFWLKINLTGGSGGGHAALFIRSDNLYVSGFSNRFGRRFAFLGEEAKIPASTPLSYGSGYGDLFGKSVGFRGMDSLLISRKEAKSHLDVLANFRGGKQDVHLKKPLAFFILIVSEAERFVQIREKVFGYWELEDGGAINDMRVTTLLVNWREISCALLAWDRNGQTQQAWDRNEEANNIRSLFRINNAQDALSRVNPILQSTKCSWT